MKEKLLEIIIEALMLIVLGYIGYKAWNDTYRDFTLTTLEMIKALFA